MTEAQRILRDLLDRQSTERQKMAELARVESLTDEQRAELDRIETGTPDLERQLRAARVAVDEEQRDRRVDDTENRELIRLQEQSNVGAYVSAALEGRAVDGAERELNQALNMGADRFPLRLLAPAPVEKRETTDVDTAATPQRWLDRLFADTAAMALGVTFESVAPGTASYPVTTAGASAAQRGREEAAADADWTVGVSELKPSRNTVRAVFTLEDAARISGLEDAITRDIRTSIMEGIDRAVFLGDAGANENSANVTGLTAAANVVEKEITQASKVKGPETLTAFVELMDGIHAASYGDLRVVSSVGANILWETTVFNAAAENQTLAQFLRLAGLSWRVRGEIETDTAAGDFGAFVGRARGIEGAGVAAVWDDAMLIRDPYAKAASGEVALTLSYLWNFGLPRASNFARLKFVA